MAISIRVFTRSSLFITSILISGLTGKAAFAGPCEYRQNNDPLQTRDGYVEFIMEDKFRPFRAALPELDDTAMNAAMRSADTMWYDDESMTFLYQDSVEVVTGARANCVGRLVGERNQNNPDIARLTHYFGADYKFKFPFRGVAGTDNVTNLKVFNFWAPPKQNGRVLPVRWWKSSARGRWNWVFPVGTVFGEVLFQQGPDQNWYVFEVRTRKRHLEGWEPNVFRPFATAAQLEQAIVARRPQWHRDANLARFVDHLKNRETLVAHTMRSEAYHKIFPPIQGALDKLPVINDKQLVVELLTGHRFRSTEGQIWKENGQLETYAPASEDDFSIVPKGYEMGMIAVNEESCNRCHIETGRRLGDLEPVIQLYGEVWGEDRLFTWHLFQPHRYIFNTWDDVDGSRMVNPRMVQANLLRNERPAANDTVYRQLPTPYPRVD
jgi:hypothetical protein